MPHPIRQVPVAGLAMLLALPAVGGAGQAGSVASAVNDRGWVAGHSWTDYLPVHATLWRPARR